MAEQKFVLPQETCTNEALLEDGDVPVLILAGDDQIPFLRTEDS